MYGAKQRIETELIIRNRTAWNTAALVGMAMAGKLPRYEDIFTGQAAQVSARQTPEQQETALRVLAASWGASSGA